MLATFLQKNIPSDSWSLGMCLYVRAIVFGIQMADERMNHLDIMIGQAFDRNAGGAVHAQQVVCGDFEHPG